MEPSSPPLPETERLSLRVHAALLFVAVLFSLNYIISKLAMHAFHPLTFAWLRVLGSALVLNALPQSRVPLTFDDERQIAGLALLGVVINQTLFLGGLSLTSAHVAAILITTIPLFTLAAAIVAGRERASAARIGGIVLAGAGALLVVGGEGLRGAGSSLAGTLLLIGNCLAYGTYLAVSKPVMARLSARRVLARMFAVGTLLMLPIAALPLARQEWSSVPPRAWLALLLVIAGPTVGAYLISGWALRHADSSMVAAYTYVQPVLTTILATIWLHESIRGGVILAGVLIFAGIYVAGRPAPPAAREEAVPGSAD